MNIQALAFHTGNTVPNWHSGHVGALAAIGSRHGIERDWNAMAKDWSRQTMQQIVGQARLAFHMDEFHRRVLDETILEFDLEVISAPERDELWRTWHQLDAWPDFAPALTAIRKCLPVVSFMMLPTARRS